MSQLLMSQLLILGKFVQLDGSLKQLDGSLKQLDGSLKQLDGSLKGHSLSQIRGLYFKQLKNSVIRFDRYI